MLHALVNLHEKHHGWVGLTAAVALFACACQKGEPPTLGVSSAAPLTIAPPPPRASSTARAAPAPATPAAASSSAGSNRAGAGDAGSSPPAATDAGATDGASLPQTRDKPAADTAAFEARARALFDGIVHDDPERAMPFFFPVAAYQQVKAVAHPEVDWKRRLVANYARDIHALAANVKDVPDARFVRVSVPNQARWVEPQEEYNRIGYYRVYGAQIFWTAPDGKERSFRISSMISWRGEWYVVHLTGFK
ncbi:hypothetical protein [Pendulispora albinea]|uniref:Uncharacterized protein n=1 Tax=Pendulispora albinea TaxID=2741071 RepID=A0ABZ2M9N5_9BACT